MERHGFKQRTDMFDLERSRVAIMPSRTSLTLRTPASSRLSSSSRCSSGSIWGLAGGALLPDGGVRGLAGAFLRSRFRLGLANSSSVSDPMLCLL